MLMIQKQTELEDLALLDRLRNQIRRVETAGRMDDGVSVSSGCAAIDRLLPGSGYQRGTLIQWLTSGGQGADYLSLLAAREACRDGGALVVLDPLNQFYPPAAAAIGVNLDNLIVLRTDGLAGSQQAIHTDFLWSIDQSLRCPAVAAVWGALDEINERWFRRFQLSAEASGCLGLFIQPIRAVRQPSWAEVQWMVSHMGELDRVSRNRSEQRVCLQLTRCRGTQTGKTVNLKINSVTGNVQLARRDNEQYQRSRKKDPLSVAFQLAHSAIGRQRA